MAATPSLKSAIDVFDSVCRVLKNDWSADLLKLINEFKYILEWKGEDGQNVMHFAADYGAAKCIKTLYRSKPSLIKEQDIKGQTPLHKAAQKTDLLCCETLLKLDSSICNLKDNKDKTAVDIFPDLLPVTDYLEIDC